MYLSAMEPLNFTSAIMLSQHLGSRDVNSSKSDKCSRRVHVQPFLSLTFSLEIEMVNSQSLCNLPFYYRLARTLSDRSKFKQIHILEVFKSYSVARVNLLRHKVLNNLLKNRECIEITRSCSLVHPSRSAYFLEDNILLGSDMSIYRNYKLITLLV
jgi:hypothetical protein